MEGVYVHMLSGLQRAKQNEKQRSVLAEASSFAICAGTKMTILGACHLHTCSVFRLLIQFWKCLALVDPGRFVCMHLRYCSWDQGWKWGEPWEQAAFCVFREGSSYCQKPKSYASAVPKWLSLGASGVPLSDLLRLCVTTVTWGLSVLLWTELVWGYGQSRCLHSCRWAWGSRWHCQDVRPSSSNHLWVWDWSCAYQ